ncbi:MAG: hypothetical protein QM765_12055 [Myxococcales bacterium]
MKVHFASADEAKALLGSPNRFVSALSPFDRSARLGTDKPVDQDRFLAHVRASVREWKAKDQAKVSAALRALQAHLDGLKLPWPETVNFVATDGSEEGGAAYTRLDAVVLPQPYLAQESEEGLRRSVAHELFHVLARRNTDLRDALYGLLGFKACANVPFPEELAARRLTNPDAPESRHFVEVTVAGKAEKVVPVIYSRTQRYDPKTKKPFFEYLDFRFMEITVAPDGGACTPKQEKGRAVLVAPDKVSGFFEQVGKNSGYIIHPEEILADNFAILLMETKGAPSPEVLERIGKVLAKYPAKASPK